MTDSTASRKPVVSMSVADLSRGLLKLHEGVARKIIADFESGTHNDGYPYPANMMLRLIEERGSLLARALPTPRRYTGGPLEDGLYLWREDHWPAGKWSSMDPQGLATPNDCSSWVGRYGPFWLIGPIPIPNLPEEEAKS